MEALGPLSRVAPLQFEGRPLPFTLPRWGWRLARDGDVARYLFAGEPDFSAARAPWRYVEQMGAAHRFQADGVRLMAITRKRGRFLSEAKLVVEAEPVRTPGMEPRMGRL
jgi:hypothetical protein